jgi:putative PIN family toxin of toxin-antitoxin system
MRVVFDTNVLVAAFLTEGVCAKLLARARKKQFDLFICPFILNEFKRVMSKKIKASKAEVDEALELLLEAVKTVVHPERESVGTCRDPDDDNVLLCAVASKAGFLVTGDDDLLILGAHGEIKIIRPRDFELLFSD